MNFFGNQLRAARVLLDLDQVEFAKLTGISINTIRTMEACGPDQVGGFASTREKVLTALQAAGIEFLNHGEPGVRLRKVRATGAPAKPTRPRKTRK